MNPTKLRLSLFSSTCFSPLRSPGTRAHLTRAGSPNASITDPLFGLWLSKSEFFSITLPLVFFYIFFCFSVSVSSFSSSSSSHSSLTVMAAIAVRKKVISIGHFSPCFCLQSLQFFLFVRSNQEQLYVLNALKIREK